MIMHVILSYPPPPPPLPNSVWSRLLCGIHDTQWNLQSRIPLPLECTLFLMLMHKGGSSRKFIKFWITNWPLYHSTPSPFDWHWKYPLTASWPGSSPYYSQRTCVVATPNSTTKKECNILTSRFSRHGLNILTARLVPWSLGTNELKVSILSSPFQM